MDEERSVARKAIKDEDITWPTIYDGSPGAGGICRKWHISQFPTIVVLDHEGRIRHRDIPPFELERCVNALLAEVPRTSQDRPAAE